LKLGSFEIHWGYSSSTDKARVVISVGANCSAKCSFCYTPELKDKIDCSNDYDVSSLVKLLEEDERFVSGLNGTIISLGGLSEPLDGKLKEGVTLELIQSIRQKHSNFIQLSTRFCYSNINLEKFSNIKNLLTNYSMASVCGSLEIGRQSTLKRFQQANELISNGALASLYIRPVIPGFTLEQAPLIIENLKNSSIKFVIVGGIYFNQPLLDRIGRKKVVVKSNEYYENSKLIVDDESKLRKLKQPDDKVLTDILKREEFEVFNSSLDLVNHIIQLQNNKA
jgi:DNA repair photolyase